MSYQIASVLLPRPVTKRFDYRVPDRMTLADGTLVIVPLGNHRVTGVVHSQRHGGTGDDQRKLKEIIEPCPGAPALSASMRNFIDRSARYTCNPTGRILAMVLGAHGGAQPAPTSTQLVASGVRPARMTAARERVLASADGQGATALARDAGVSATTVARLVACGALIRRTVPTDGPYETPNPAVAPMHRLAEAQQRAASQIQAAIGEHAFRAILLDGVTGSGKTSVYLEAVAHALSQDETGQILIMTPEIALAETVAILVARRFGAEPPVWHAEVTPSTKRRIWREVAHGRTRVVVGARSALFLPFARLSLIVVDEEHDSSYKQDDGVSYQGRDLAVLRASMDMAAVLLVSATPSLETLQNVRSLRYRSVSLPCRYGTARLPEVTLADLRTSKPESGRYLAPDLVAATRSALEADEQVLLFLNRRGYAPLVICRACGHRLKAPDTDSWLAEHRASGRLVCHITGFSMARPLFCPHCKGADTLTGVGPGVERIAEEARILFPQARIATLSSDSSRQRAGESDVIARMERGDIDILVGTQIVAKGHHFPRLTLVGVVDADSGLSGIDFRASERTYQLLCQVAGRAGRATLPGRAILQTHLPETPALRALASGDREGFIRAEMAARETAGMPPFGRLAAVIVSACNGPQADTAARALARAAPRSAGIDLWGPAPAQIAVLRGRHRRRFLLRSERSIDLSAYLTEWRARTGITASVRVALDVEPYNFS